MGVALILASILSSVSRDMVSRPLEIRMTYLRPSTRVSRSSVSYSASNSLVSLNPGMTRLCSASARVSLLLVKSVRMWVRRS